MSDMRPSSLSDTTTAALLFAVLLQRAGNAVTVTQDDIDAVSFHWIAEQNNADGSREFRLEKRKLNT